MRSAIFINKNELNSENCLKELLNYLHKNFLLIVMADQSNNDLNSLATKDTICNEFPQIDDLYYCFYSTDKDYECSKINLMMDASEDYNLDLGSSWIISTNRLEIDASKKLECRSIYLNDGLGDCVSGKEDYLVLAFDQIMNVFELEKYDYN